MSNADLDTAIRLFKQYCEGHGDFDELDLKETIYDHVVANAAAEAYRQGYIAAGINNFTQ